MSQHAVAAYHEGLDDGLARESSEWLTARQRDIGLTFGERPLCTVIRPRFLSPHEYDTLRTASASLLGAFRHAGAMAQDDAEFRAQFRLADWEEQLLERAPRLHVAAPLSRLDAFIDPVTGIARITEYNGETPAGTGYTDALAELFLALPAMRPFLERWVVRPLPAMGHVHNVLLESWHRFRGVRTVPSIAIVDWDDVPTQAEFRICLDYFRAMGVPCRITTPEALRYEGGKLKDADGTVIDLIYKRVLLHELIAEGGLNHPMVRAVADGAVCMVNPFACKPLHKKASLAVLSDERNAGRFSHDERAAISRHVPWTRVVEERKTVIEGSRSTSCPGCSGSASRSSSSRTTTTAAPASSSAGKSTTPPGTPPSRAPWPSRTWCSNGSPCRASRSPPSTRARSTSRIGSSTPRRSAGTGRSWTAASPASRPRPW
ncbi:MAG: hypothetical protein IPO52_05760 [Gemmatimonadetes bacterium]|nr:hypothetical protein [Gemmatimonadota bacterium]